MSVFNVTVKQVPDIINKAGGQAFSLKPKSELITLVLTSFLQDKNYETGKEQLARIKKLCSEISDKKFIAQLAIYARDKFGMRSVSHVLAGEIANTVKNETWTKSFFNKVVVRVDDMSEILSYYFGVADKKGKKHAPIPNSVKKGFAKAFEKFDSYQLAKYKAEAKELKLVDLVNLIHPKPFDKNGVVKIERSVLENILTTLKPESKSYKNLVRTMAQKYEGEGIYPISSLQALTLGLLKSTDTWESKQSKTGQEVAKKAKELKLNEVEKEKLLTEEKADNWKELIETRKIGYFALLRNIRNIAKQAPNLVDKACELLVDEKLINSSRVLPFRFLTVIKEIGKLVNEIDSTILIKFMQALNRAVDLALKNVPTFEGNTLIAIDVSGSMTSAIKSNKDNDNTISCAEIAGLFGVTLAKANQNSNVVLFDNSATHYIVNPNDSILTNLKNINFRGGGTTFSSIFRVLKKGYDRIIILSDMQSWNDSQFKDTFKSYKSKFDCNPFIFSVDLQGYGSSVFPESKVALLTGFSEKMFETMKNLEQDKNALIKEIESIEI